MATKSNTSEWLDLAAGANTSEWFNLADGGTVLSAFQSSNLIGWVRVITVGLGLGQQCICIYKYIMDGLTGTSEPRSLDGSTWMPEPKSLDGSTWMPE